jgi:hypothetical protein
LQPRAALPPVASASSSRVTSSETTETTIADHPVAAGNYQEPREAPTTRHKQKTLSVVPKHWGEVIISTRKGKKAQATDCDAGNNEFFAVLKVV